MPEDVRETYMENFIDIKQREGQTAKQFYDYLMAKSGEIGIEDRSKITSTFKRGLLPQYQSHLIGRGKTLNELYSTAIEAELKIPGLIKKTKEGNKDKDSSQQKENKGGKKTPRCKNHLNSTSHWTSECKQKESGHKNAGINAINSSKGKGLFKELKSLVAEVKK